MKRQYIFSVIGSALAIGAGALLLVNREPAKYSDKWFKSLSREELDAEREIIVAEHCSVKGNFSLGIRLKSLLDRFDNEIRKRDHSDLKSEGYKYPPPREHGWNLYKPD